MKRYIGAQGLIQMMEDQDRERRARLNGPVLELVEFSRAWVIANKAKAQRMRSMNRTGRADDLDAAVMMVEQLLNVLEPLSDLVSDIGTSEDDDSSPRLPLED